MIHCSEGIKYELIMIYNFLDNFPVLLEFSDLHLPKNLKAAKLALKGLSGIYAIVYVLQVVLTLEAPLIRPND
jgi:hypothetical protein